MADLQNLIFQDAEKAREFLEATRWPDGAYCPHCGELENVHKLDGKAHRPGLYQCNSCLGQFSVTVGTLFERSKIPLNKWLLATHLLCASKKGISSHQLHRMLGVTYKTAWFMSHRIREAMKDGVFSGPLGGKGSTVEADETFIGRKKGKRVSYGYEHKHKVLALVDRETGRSRAIVVDNLNSKTIAPILRMNVSRAAKLMTDEARHYVKVGREYADHQVVQHSAGEYVRGEAHTNTIEGYFSIFKRGMKGIYQHCGEQHLHRYLAEYDFRYSNRVALGVDDNARAVKALKGISGRRLTYRRASQRPNV